MYSEKERISWSSSAIAVPHAARASRPTSGKGWVARRPVGARARCESGRDLADRDAQLMVLLAHHDGRSSHQASAVWVVLDERRIGVHVLEPVLALGDLVDRDDLRLPEEGSRDAFAG